MASNPQDMDATEESIRTDETRTGEPTGTGIDGNAAGALSYLLGLLTGIVFYVIDDRKFVRFHAAQSIAFSLVVFGAVIVLTVLQIVFGAVTVSGSFTGAVIGGLLSLVILLFWLVLLVGAFATWLYMMFKAYQGKTPRMPLAAGIADRLV